MFFWESDFMLFGVIPLWGVILIGIGIVLILTLIIILIVLKLKTKPAPIYATYIPPQPFSSSNPQTSFYIPNQGSHPPQGYYPTQGSHPPQGSYPNQSMPQVPLHVQLRSAEIARQQEAYNNYIMQVQMQKHMINQAHRLQQLQRQQLYEQYQRLLKNHK